MKRRTFLKFGTGASLGALLTACGGSAVVEEPAPRLHTVYGWSETALQAIRDARPGPPMAARSLAVVHTAMYDAWAAYDAVALSTQHGGRLRRPVSERTPENKARAISYAAYATLLDQFPRQKALFDARMAALGYRPGDASLDGSTPEGIGTLAAQSCIRACHADGANQLGTLSASGIPYSDYTGYQPKNPPAAVTMPTPAADIPAPGNWQPLTYPDAAGVMRTPPCLAACWPRVRPFALQGSDQYRPGAPVAYGTRAFVDQTMHVVELTRNLGEREKVIAEYWADGPGSELPPGHWMLFGQFVSERDRHGDDEDVKMFFALANAVFDAGIAAWDAKMAYDSVRPITAARYLLQGQTVIGYGTGGVTAGMGPVAGESWVPFQPLTFPTPPFPEHVSGHSTFSAASAEVLRRFTGSDRFGASFVRQPRTMLIDPTQPSAAVTLGWSTFSAAAEEAGMSRLYGGIHFEQGNLDGQSLGRRVGEAVFRKAERLWLGLG